MDQRVKHILAEVICGFTFNPVGSKWDSTYFGEYYKKILNLGFSEKSEQKGVKVKVQVNLNSGTVKGNSSEQNNSAESRMIFRNSKDNSAIILSPNYISFHKLAPYNNWEDFLDRLIKPGISHYSELGLFGNLSSIGLLYLNQYEVPEEFELSDLFAFLPNVRIQGAESEENIFYMTQYKIESDLLAQIKLNVAKKTRNMKIVTLECSCTIQSPTESPDWLTLATKAHSANGKVFNHLIK